MKTGYKKFLLRVAGVAVISVATTGAINAQSANQFALQMGALQLGYISNSPATASNLTAQQIANALVQGQLALQATSTNAYPYVIGAASTPPAQSDAFREQICQAQLFVTMSPVSFTNPALTVHVTNPVSSTSSTTNISPALSPSTANIVGLFNVVANRVPNRVAGAVSNNVAAAMAFKTDSHGVYLPVWGAQPTAADIAKAATNTAYRNSLNTNTYNAQLATALTIASNALSSTINTYLNGTLNWAAVPSNGVTFGQSYLPNYSTNAIPNENVPYQQPNLTGMANAAAAIAANAINGLGGANANIINPTPYGKTTNSVYQMTKVLITAAAAKQQISTSTVTLQSGDVYSGYTLFGTVGATAFGEITQVAGKKTVNWDTNASPFFVSLCQSVVKGAVSADPTDVPAIARGVASGFYANYLHYATGTNIQSYAQFQSNNTIAIYNSFISAGASTSYGGLALTNIINSAIKNLYVNVANGNYDRIAGASGINLTNGISITNSSVLFTGVGTPVTDTLGL